MSSLGQTVHVHGDRTVFGLSHEFEPVAHVGPGDVIVVDICEASGGQLTRASTAADVAHVSVDRTNPGTGPIYIEGALPGDVLQVDILDLETESWGWTAQSGGFGLLPGVTEDWLYVWDLSGSRARFADGISIPIDPFCGLMWVAPREPGVHWDAPRRTGGNMDIKQLRKGTSLFLPVEVNGALLTIGDAHAAQGDGEVCGSAIECSAQIKLRVAIRRDLQVETPEFETTGDLDRGAAPSAGHYVTTGLAPELHDAARISIERMVAHLETSHRLTFQEAYALCSVCVDLRISAIVNEPGLVVAACLPKEIFG